MSFENKFALEDAAPKAESVSRRKELVAGEYAVVTGLRDENYQKEIEEDPKRKPMLSALEAHNKIVLDYANELITENPELNSEDKVAATLATILHDGGKLSSTLLEHHLKGTVAAEEILNNLMSSLKSFEGFLITERLKRKVKEAIERHMNHPFLVKQNKGERFPEPQDAIDKVVFDADMLANIGFKNVMFRLINEHFSEEDRKTAEEKDITPIQAAFENVLEGAKDLESTVMSAPAKELAKKLIGVTKEIFEGMDFKRIDLELKGEKDPQIIKKFLNEEIERIGKQVRVEGGVEAGIDIKNFLM